MKNYLFFCAWLSFGGVVGGELSDKKLLEEIESSQQFLEEFEADLSLEILTKQFTKTVSECHRSFNAVSEELGKVLYSYPIESYDVDSTNRSTPEVNAATDDIDDFFSSLIDTSTEEEDVLQRTYINRNVFDAGKKPHYLEQAEILVRAFDHACSSLPKVLNVTRFRRSPQNAMQGLFRSFSRWMERWTHSTEKKFEKFLQSCLDHKVCQSFLKKLIQKWIQFSKFRGKIGSETSEILEQLLVDVKWDRKKYSHLSELQRMSVSNYFDDFYLGEDEASFDIAQEVSGFRDDIKRQQLRDLMISFTRASRLNFEEPQGEIQVETDKLVGNVPDTFLSVALGAGLIQKHFKGLTHRYSQLVTLASALTPAVLRVGGTAANFLNFDPTQTFDSEEFKASLEYRFIKSVKHPKTRNRNREMINAYEISQRVKPSRKHPKHKSMTQYVLLTQLGDDFETDGHEACESHLTKDQKNFTMTGDDWSFLANFIHDLGWSMLFDLNQFSRDSQNNWDPTNARLLFEETHKRDMKVFWQLGNEPNSYNHTVGWALTPQRAASDYDQLKKELAKSNLTQFIVGPDVTSPRNIDQLDTGVDSMNFFTKFLRDADNIVNAVTFHQYYVDGRTATLEEFLSPKTMNLFVRQLDKVTSIVKNIAPNKPIWITETADAWGGGAPGLSNSFVGAFLWLDKLGAAALGGVSCVIRQTLYRGCYALLDPQLNPYPDYWVSVLHKQTVGNGVLLPRTRLASEFLRVYAHCLKKEHKLYKRGAVVLFGINTSNKLEKLSLANVDLKRSNIYKYILSAPENDLTSRNILLNAELLELTNNGELPELIPVHEDQKSELEFLPYSMSFWIFPDTLAAAC